MSNKEIDTSKAASFMPDASKTNRVPLEKDKEVPLNAQYCPNIHHKSGSVPITPGSSPPKSSDHPAMFYNVSSRGQKIVQKMI